jgi:hypothetical protein
MDEKFIKKTDWFIKENSAECKSDFLTMQYINNKNGMRQNFIVEKPLKEKENLELNFTIQTNLKTKIQSNQIQFYNQIIVI